MTVSESIIRWLKQFEASDNSGMERIDTDIQCPEEYTYSLVREPVQNIKKYLSGKKIYTDHYTLQAFLPSQYDPSRVHNNSFGEELEKWIRKQNDNKYFPEISGATVKNVRITTPFYVGQTRENDSIYQMTIAIMYERED